MTKWSPTSSWLGGVGTNSVAVAAATSNGGRLGYSQDGHNEGVVSQSGPSCHSLEGINACVVVPLDRRSAGLASVGQYLQLTFGRLVWISVTRFHTKVGSCFVLLTQCSTIWLSDQMNTGGSCMGRCVSTNCVSLEATRAAINSRRGSVSCFNGAT